MTDPIQSTDVPGQAQADNPAEPTDRAGLKQRWSLEIERYERKAGKFERRGKKIVKRYTAEEKDEEARTTHYNVLWSNIQTLRPALYAKDPTPEVERRFKDRDPVGRCASDVLERCCSYLVSKQEFGDTMRQVVLDRLLPGRGIAWIRYVPHMRDAAIAGNNEVKEDGSSLTDDVDSDAEGQESIQEVYWEEVKFDFVPWTDFGHTVARTWEELDGVWRIAYLDRKQLVDRFGAQIANQIPLDTKPDGLDKDSEGQDGLSKARIYEIWDKRNKRAIWLHRAVPEALDVRDDPLKLDGFFPCPKPLQATVSSDSFIPTADYILWSDQAAELDRLTQRISMLTKAIKVVGIYDSSAPALQSLLNSGVENRLVPVESWAAFAEKGGIKGSMELMDVSMVAQVLLQLYEARDKVKQDLYEISGLSDLLRGASDPETTATAEQIKSNYASVRLKDMQREVQCFARDMIRIAGEIVAEHFSLDTIKQICGVSLLTNQEKFIIKQQMTLQQQAQQAMQQHQASAQQAQQSGQMPPPAPAMPSMPPIDPEKIKLLDEPSWEDVEALLRDDAARNFRIDIETDSTIAQDEQTERTARLEFAKTVGDLLTGAVQIVQEVPELASAISETFMFVLRSFKVGRPTESAFQEAMDKLVEKASQPQQAKPDPAQIKAQADVQIQQARTQADQQSEAMRIASEEKLAIMQANLDKQVAQATQVYQQQQFEAQARIDAHYKAMEAANNERLERMRMAMEQQNQQTQNQLQILLAHIKAANAVEVAEIGSQTTLQAAQISAANAAASSDKQTTGESA